VPPVTEFIYRLPETATGYAVPFVTWGCVNSGLALSEMGKALTEKGYRIPGAAALPAVHSMLWLADEPLGKGRPDAQDEAEIIQFTAAVSAKIASGSGSMVGLSDLDYQAPSIREGMQKITLEGVRNVLPSKTVDENRCAKCGQCATVCPASAITFSPYPVFGAACFLCYNCVRLCPEQAILSDFSMMEANLHQRADSFNEATDLKLFY